MIGRNFIVKSAKIFSEHNASKFTENSIPLPKNRKKIEIISLSYDINDHVCSKYSVNFVVT